MRLSKTRVRCNSLHGTPEKAPEPRLAPVSLAFDRRSRVYGALLHQAQDFTQGSTWAGYVFESPQWVMLFENAGIPVEVLKQQRIAWLADEVQALRHLRLRFSLPTLIGSGLFDPDGRFRFARHRILIPFRKGREMVYLVGVDPELGFADVLLPSPAWPIPYRVPQLEPEPAPRRLYLTLELKTALRLGALGYAAWAVQSPKQLEEAWLERLKQREVVFCLDVERMDGNVVSLYQRLLEKYCTRFRWQTLGQAETEWVVIQSREERAQRVEGNTRLRPPDSNPFLGRLTRAFRRRSGSLRHLFSL